MNCVASANDFSDDVFMIADAFRKAGDEDTRIVLNAMSAAKTPSSYQGLMFFMVPMSWMVKAWPLISSVAPGNAANVDDGDSWREKVGPIQNSELLEWEHAVSSSSDEEGLEDGDKKIKAKKSTPPASAPLRSNLQHGEDFLLLGPSAWMLLSQKFGSDNIELSKPVIYHEPFESKLAVEIEKPSSSSAAPKVVEIPAGGHFHYRYKEFIEKAAGETDESFLPQGNPIAAQAAAAAARKTDVVSDEEGDPPSNDLFPGRNDNPEDMVLSSGSAQPDSVLLLPPSNTQNNNDGSLYPSVHDMEEDGSNKDDSDDIASSNIIPAASIASNTRKRYGTGLSNLGNTCFMNSSLQCLAHTDPLRKYFLSGEYTKDLNRDNPLGTGGDLAVQFANLLAEMWGTKGSPLARNDSVYSSSAVYPREFKYTLGKHAEQFVGYDQHDSQELATYLLDALHEDTNRVSKKPYIEKPEQGEDEPDVVAAKKAWELHLKREDSRVLENFMGLVKSRVQCNVEGCGRVSTTFDPIMYMSVPIPGSTDRTLRVTFVPLDGNERKRNLSITISKTAKMSKLINKVAEQLMKAGLSAQGRPYALSDLRAADVWSHEVYQWYDHNDDIDKIRDSDDTYVFELKPQDQIQNAEVESENALSDEVLHAISDMKDNPARTKRFTLDLGGQLKTNGEGWKQILEEYSTMNKMQLAKVLNFKRGTRSERYELFITLDDFLDKCISELEKAGNKRAREEGDEDVGSSSPMDQSIEPIPVYSKEGEVPGLTEVSKASDDFKDVKTRYDVALLEVCHEKLRQMILDTGASVDKTANKDGIEIQVNSRKSSSRSSHYSTMQDKGFVNPIVIRIPSNMSVYSLREELAKRLSRCLRLSQPLQQPAQQGEASDTVLPTNETSERDVIPMEGDQAISEEVQSGVESMNVSNEPEASNGDPALLILKQIPLSYRRRSAGGYRLSSSPRQLGSLEVEQAYDPSRPISLASPTDEDEKQLVSDIVGDQGGLFLEWPAELCNRVFDDLEFEASDELKDPDEEEANAALSMKEKKTTTIYDCIEKYCQMEQLEESEMWYCNRCKDHVRAYKQFNLYRSPPILIMHFKRFQYSASSHRRDKINTFIDFPLTNLDLTGHVMEWTEKEKPIYDCYAVSNHYGGLGGGHYTAYCLNDDGEWCYFDDSRVTTDIDPKEVVTDAAYVVYYRRIDVEVSGLGFLEGLQETANIVQDHLENTETVPNNNASNANNATLEMEIDGDVNTTDAESHASSKTMESHDNPAETFGGDGNIVYGGPLGEDSKSGNDFPLQ